MKKINVDIQEGYPIYIGKGIVNQLPKMLKSHGISSSSKLVCITDQNLAPIYAEKIAKILRLQEYDVAMIIIPAGETSKSMATIESLIAQCLEYGLDRQGVILALGGGVVGDIAGFVAATYMRGIRYVHIPTTIIAHDSCIGGKVGINHPLGKNVIGAFHQPQFVLFDVSFLETLPSDERIAGYAEVLKHGLIQDKSFVVWLKKNNEALLTLCLDKVEEAIYRSCAIKATIVSQDEKEKGLRMILNYGHTIGHAMETVTKYNQYKHGEAVAIGMCGAAYLSEGIYGQGIVKQTTELLEAFQLPTQFIGSYSDDQLLSIMKRDKKRNAAKYTFILSSEVGKANIAQPEEERIKEALRKIRRG